MHNNEHDESTSADRDGKRLPGRILLTIASADTECGLLGPRILLYSRRMPGKVLTLRDAKVNSPKPEP